MFRFCHAPLLVVSRTNLEKIKKFVPETQKSKERAEVHTYIIAVQDIVELRKILKILQMFKYWVGMGQKVV